MLSILVSESDSKLHKWQLRVLTAIRGRIETAMNLLELDKEVEFILSKYCCFYIHKDEKERV